jgi:hypothetical protein
MKWRGILCALAALCVLVVVAVPSASSEEACQPGFVQGESTSSAEDADGDGLVCVDPDTGEVSDDQAATPGVVDRNGDGIVCVRQAGNGMIVRTDNRSAHTENAGCPPAFQPSPLL